MSAFRLVWLGILCFAAVSGTTVLGPYGRLVKRLLFPPSGLRYSTAIIFDGNQGEINREDFRKAYGHRGRLLIESYGAGLSPEKLKALGYL